MEKEDTRTWFQNAEFVYKAIAKEIESTPQTQHPQKFPKLVVMYEFFRMLRGEAFLDQRGPVTGEEQSRLYAMEDDLAKKLDAFRSQLDPSDEAVKFYIDEMKRDFNINK